RGDDAEVVVVGDGPQHVIAVRMGVGCGLGLHALLILARVPPRRSMAPPLRALCHDVASARRDNARPWSMAVSLRSSCWRSPRRDAPCSGGSARARPLRRPRWAPGGWATRRWPAS